MFADKKIIHAATCHAADCYPNESCGFVVNGRYMPRRNCHETPQTNFRISPQGYLWAARRGEIQAVVHSHPDGPDYPSHHDMQLQQQGDIPWLVIPTTAAPFWFGDQVPIAPYIGRRFRPGVHDCYSIIRDWYRKERRITLMDMPRHHLWWERGDDLYMANFKEAGFRKLGDDEELQRGDVLLAAILSNGIINHAALYMGRNQIMHHLIDRLSGPALLSTWRKLFTITMRYDK